MVKKLKHKNVFDIVDKHNTIAKMDADYSLKFYEILKDKYYDDVYYYSEYSKEYRLMTYNEYEYISPNMFSNKLLKQLKSGLKATYTHGFLFLDEGSAWEYMYNWLKKVYSFTKPKFEMTFERMQPFKWAVWEGQEWIRNNFKKIYHSLEEYNSDEFYDYMFFAPTRWGDLTISIHCKTEEERLDAICWLKQFMATANKIINTKKVHP